MNGLVILDTPALYYRAFYALPVTLVSPDGTPINALRGTLDTVTSLMRTLTTTRMIAAFDADWRPAFRTRLAPHYKAQRERPDKPGTETPDGLIPQIPLIMEALEAAGIPIGHIEGTEADDVIGSVAQTAEPLTIVSPDRDLISLLTPTTTLIRPRTGGEWETIRLDDLGDLYGVTTGERYRELAALRGDPSDGLPGAPGIGEKTAAKLLKSFGTLDALYEAARRGVKDHGLTPKRQASLLDAQEDVYTNVAVMTIQTDLDVAGLINAADHVPARLNADALRALGARCGLERVTERLIFTISEVAAPAAGPSPDTPQGWADGPLLAFDVETTGRNPHAADLVQAAVIDVYSNRTWEWVVYPEADIPPEATDIHGITTEYARAHGLPLAQVVAQICELFADHPGSVVAHNAPYDFTVLARACALTGCHLPSVSIVDTFVLDKHVEPYRKGPRTLDAVATRWEVALDNAHNAVADARAAGLIAVAIADAFPAVAGLTPQALHAAQVDWKREQAQSLQQYVRKTRDPNAVIDPAWPYLKPGDN